MTVGAPVQELKLPELGENIDSVEVSAVLVVVGDQVARDQPVIEVETEKASLEVPAPAAGKVTELLVSKGDQIKVGQVVLRIETGAGEAEDIPEAKAATGGAVAVEPSAPPPLPEQDDAPVVTFPAKHKPKIGRAVPAAPSARALARQLGVDINEVPGHGAAGRINREDVKAYVKSLVQGGGGAAPSAPGAAPTLPDFSQWGEIEREPLTNIRRATAAAMSNAWNTVPHVTQFDRADITQLESMRKRFNQRPEAEGRKMTVTAILIKLVALALKQFPKFNSSLDLAADAVVHKKYVHIGVAVDTPRGLLVPVIRDADVKNVVQIATELNEMASRARDRKLKPDEMRGGTFTITNLGGLGTTYFSPIVNWPEVAILGVGRAEQHAIWGGGRFEPRLIIPLSLSYDHRLVDGADAARFLRWTAEALEQPLLLLLED
jgi:pyruvate dehydrogenase E2 component (dihydrolipoamide acetyltransferase)